MAAEDNEQDQEEDEEAECTICLLALGKAGEGSATLAGCGHVFHAGCIAEDRVEGHVPTQGADADLPLLPRTDPRVD